MVVREVVERHRHLDAVDALAATNAEDRTGVVEEQRDRTATSENLDRRPARPRVERAQIAEDHVERCFGRVGGHSGPNRVGPLRGCSPPGRRRGPSGQMVQRLPPRSHSSPRSPRPRVDPHPPCVSIQHVRTRSCKMTGTTLGRRRGDRTRDAILDATLELIGAGGPRAVTYRACGRASRRRARPDDVPLPQARRSAHRSLRASSSAVARRRT